MKTHSQVNFMTVDVVKKITGSNPRGQHGSRQAATMAKWLVSSPSMCVESDRIVQVRNIYSGVSLELVIVAGSTFDEVLEKLVNAKLAVGA